MLKEMTSLVGRLAPTSPILLFGHEWEASERFGLGEEYTVTQLRDENDLSVIKELASNTNKLVVGLPLACAVGVDIRFKEKNAVVVIVADVMPLPEEVRQMVARGNRTLGSYVGYVFCNEDPKMSSHL